MDALTESNNEKKNPPKVNTFMGTRQDFRESWRLLQANFRAFNSTIIFALCASIFTIILLFLIIGWVTPSIFLNSNRFFFDSDFRWISVIVGFLILTVFINCQTGLAHDIMSSGDMFAEFKSSFYYFRQHWWKYILLSFLMGGPTSGFPQSIISGSIKIIPTEHLSPFSNYILGALILVIFFGLSFLWNSIFSQSLASINAQGNLANSIIESIRIFKANPKRLLSTWGLYYLIFYSPIWIFEIIMRFVQLSDISIIIVILSFMLIYGLVFLFIGLPMRALLITGLYNNIEFKRFSLKSEKDTLTNNTISNNSK